MTDLIDTVQLQEIDDSIVDLFDVTLPDGVTTVYLFNGLDEGTDNLYFPNKSNTELKEYVAMPIELTGLESSSSGPQNRPSLTMANIPVLTKSYGNTSDGFEDETVFNTILSDNNIFSNDDFLNSRIVYRRTLLSKTFKEADSLPLGGPVEFPSATYIVDRVSSENSIVVSFELASPIDIEGVVIPNRVVIGRYCPWRYQGDALAAEGGCTWPLDSNGRFFDKNDDVITKDITTISEWNNLSTYTLSANDSPPTRVKTLDNSHTQIWRAIRDVPADKAPSTSPFYWVREDVCGKQITSCKLRYQGNNSNTEFNTSQALQFGGFPGGKTFK